MFFSVLQGPHTCTFFNHFIVLFYAIMEVTNEIKPYPLNIMHIATNELHNPDYESYNNHVHSYPTL